MVVVVVVVVVVLEIAVNDKEDYKLQVQLQAGYRAFVT